MSWFVSTPQGNRGPFDAQKLQELITAGHLNAESWVWQQGAAEEWVQLKDTDIALPSTPVAPPAATQAGAGDMLSGNDDEMDAIFIEQVKKSWTRHKAKVRATEVDEVLVGGVITGVLDNGFSLIDLTSDGANHYLRFEEIATGHRVIFQLAHLAESLITASVIGHEAMVSIGYGERVKNFAKMRTALKQELKGGYISKADPGIITVDADISSQYIYVTVDLIWDIDDYLDPEDCYKVLAPILARDLGASIHALRKYLRGRFQT